MASALALLLAAASFAHAQPLQPDVIWPGHPASAFDAARDSARLERELASWAIEDVTDPTHGEVTRWSFRLKQDLGFNDIFWRGGIERPFEALSFWAKNLGAPFSLAIKLGETGGAEYTAPPIPLDAGGEWRKIELPFPEFKVASWSSDPNGALDFPLRYLAIIAFGVKANTDYALLLDDLAAERKPPQQVKVVSASVPRSADAGADLPVSLTLSVDKPYSGHDPVRLRLLRLSAVISEQPLQPPTPTSQWKVGEKVNLSARLHVPRYTWGGPHEVQLQVGYSDVVVGDGVGPDASHSAPPNGRKDGVIATVEISQKKSRPVVAEVRTHTGAPTLFIDGKPNSAMVYMTYNPTLKYFREFGEAGVHIYSFPSTCSRHTWPGFARQAWLAPGDHFDFSQLDEQIIRILEADPEAYVFPRVYVNSPDWWDKLHPDQLVLFDEGKGPELYHETESKPCPSWASEIWRQDTAYALTRYIEHIRSAPYADRVIGYHVASGTTEEWMYWGANDGKYCDYSPPTLAAFRDWLRRKYETDDRLRKAWGDANVTFESAAIPPFQKRKAAEHLEFRDPVAARDAIDLDLFLSDLTAETICYFARVVKQATNGQSLFGTFYGYVLQLFEQRQQNAGHLAPQAVWDCPDVDFLTSPTSYAFRNLGDGYSHFMSLTDSVKLHGKMWFDENDIRTWLTGGAPGEWGKQETYEGSRAMQEREFANVIGNACGKWWFDMGGGWYDDPRLLADIGRMKAVADRTVAWDRSPVSEVAFIVDPQSLAYLKTDNSVSTWFMLQQLPQLGRLGAPFGYYCIEDLPNVPRQKLYILANCWAPTDRQREIIEQRVKRDGAWALWLYAPGLLRENGLDEKGMQDLTGLRLRYAEEAAPLKVALSAGEEPLLRGLSPGLTYGTDQSLGPVVYADDPGATVLGKLVGSGRGGLVMRRFPTWTSVHSAAPVLPAKLLRNLASAAGAHLYVDSDDAIYANRSLLSLTVDAPGPRTVRLPKAATVEDLLTGGTVATNALQFETEMPAKSTRLWRLR